MSSGAIALGRRHLGVSPGKLKLEESQAAAAVGQIRLAHAYKEILESHEITVAQILLTLGDTEQRRRYLNARGTLNTLLALGAVPVINENDTVATAEIRYGDNDRLAARVAQMTGADCLVLLSDIDGLYTSNPHEDRQAEFISRVLDITPAIEAMAGGTSSGLGTGGMQTKIAAAKIAVGAGCHLCIAKGADAHPLKRIENGARCTWFLPNSTPSAARKQWIAGTLRPGGRDLRRRRRGACTDAGQELVAGGSDARHRPLRSRRYGEHRRTGRGGSRARHLRVFGRATRRAFSAENPPRSSNCWGFADAMRSCIATIWSC